MMNSSGSQSFILFGICTITFDAHVIHRLKKTCDRGSNLYLSYRTFRTVITKSYGQ